MWISGSISHFIYQDQDCTSMSLSASFSYASPDIRSKSPVPFREVNGDVRNDNHGKGFKSPHLFLSPRRSPRIVVILVNSFVCGGICFDLES